MWLCITKPRTWSTCPSSSDKNLIISHGVIHVTLQMPISLVPMEPAFSVDNFSAIAAAHDYVLLLGQPVSKLSGASWYIPSHLLLQSPLFSVSVSSLSILSCPHSSVVSSLSSGLKEGLIWSSLCLLNPLPMVPMSHSPAKSTFLHHSLCFPGCVKSSICILHHSFQMTSMNVTVPISHP